MAHYRDERPFILERDRSPSRDRTPAFLRDVRRPEAGPMVLRQREVETATRPHHRDHSPAFVERRRPSPDASRGRSASRVRARFARRDESESSLSSSSFSSSGSPVQKRPVFRRPRSVSPAWRERETVRARFRRESPSPSPSPPPQPQVVKGPTVERDVITHYTDIDHGVVRARQPSPQPPPRAKSRPRHADTTDIDIYTSRHETDINIHRDSHGRPIEKKYADQDGLLVVDNRRRRRAHSAAPLPARDPMREEAKYLASNIDARGRPGEARHGATRDWTIVDVPPGTERVTMDGAGGASTETTWQRYSGVRRTKFVPERDEPALEAPEPRPSRDRLSIHVGGGDREVDVKRDRRVSLRPKQPVMDTWTEITRDLVNKEAIQRMGYQYEERGQFFYIMQYLHSREIDELVELTDSIRRSRRLKKRQLLRDDWETDRAIRIHQHRHRHHRDTPHMFRHEEPRFEKQVSWERRRDLIEDRRRDFIEDRR